MNELKKILAALEMLKAETDEKGRKMSDRSGYGDIMEPDEYDRDQIVKGDEYEIGRWWEYIENIKAAYKEHKEREKKNNAGELVPLCVQRAAAEASGKFNTAETLRKLKTIEADAYFLKSKIENREAPELFGSYFEKAVDLIKEAYLICPPWFGEGCAIVARIAKDFDAIREAIKAEAEEAEAEAEEAEATEAEAEEAEATEAEAEEAEATEAEATTEPKKEDCPKAKKATACKYDRRAVMVYAWKLCRLAVNAYGGKAREYFAEALKEAWKTAKSGGDLSEPAPLDGTTEAEATTEPKKEDCPKAEPKKEDCPKAEPKKEDCPKAKKAAACKYGRRNTNGERPKKATTRTCIGSGL